MAKKPAAPEMASWLNLPCLRMGNVRAACQVQVLMQHKGLSRLMLGLVVLVDVTVVLLVLWTRWAMVSSSKLHMWQLPVVYA